MIDDLKMIKDKYGENMMHLCRECFPTILETPGLLFELLSSIFAYNKFLYDDIIKKGMIQEFKNFFYSLMDMEKQETIIDKTPKELLDEAGYTLYECKTEEDIQKFKRYYASKEKLCTFHGGRLNSCYVFFAVKKNVDEIKRGNFKEPKRQDEYGTSVISIQFSKGEKNTLSIKNRYNHRVNNPDATFSNNLENIIEGLTESFNREYNLNINSNLHNNFELDNYVKANDGKHYKYNYEINNIYYCTNNVIIDNFEVIKDYQEKEKYIVFDYFILDLENKTIKLYDEKIRDSFIKDLENINKIEVRKEKDSKNKIIYLYFEDNKVQILKINDKNQLIYYKNDYIYKIGNDFLNFNVTVNDLEIPNIVKIGNDFLYHNHAIKSLEFPNLMEVGNNFLYHNDSIKTIDCPLLELVGDNFLCSVKKISKINLPKLEITGKCFLYNNLCLTELYLPNLIKVGSGFMRRNECVNEINLPKLESAGDEFFCVNSNQIKLNLPRLEIVGREFMGCASVEVLDLPKLKVVGYEFLFSNKSLKEMNLPELELIGDKFLIRYKNSGSNEVLKKQIKNLIKESNKNLKKQQKSIKKENRKILKLEKKKNGN